MINTCFRRLARSQAYKGLSHSENLQVFSSLKPNSSVFKQTALFQIHQYNFSSSHPEPPKETTSNATSFSETHVKTNKIHGLTLSEFVSYIKSTEDKANMNYEYKNQAIYALSGGIKDRPQINKITFDKAFWKTMYAIEALVWLPISYLTYTYLSPWAAALPLLGLAVTVGGTWNAQGLMENSIMRMDLINNQQIMLYQWGNQGKGVACNIEGAQITRAEVPPLKNPTGNEEEDRQSASIEATFLDVSSKKKVKAVFLVSPGASPIENVELFRMILQGRDSEISKFEYINTPKSDQNSEAPKSE